MGSLALLFAFNYFVLVVVIDSRIFLHFHLALLAIGRLAEGRGSVLRAAASSISYLFTCYLCLGFWVALLLSTGVCAEAFGLHFGDLQRLVISGAMAVLGEAVSIATKTALKRLDQ